METEIASAATDEITWQVAFTIVGSVVAIVTGIFGYLYSLRRNSLKNGKPPSSITDIEHVHSRISEVKNRVSPLESDIKVILTRISNLQKQLDESQERDQRDFARITEKVDKLTDILMKILSDDRL